VPADLPERRYGAFHNLPSVPEYAVLDFALFPHFPPKSGKKLPFATYFRRERNVHTVATGVQAFKTIPFQSGDFYAIILPAPHVSRSMRKRKRKRRTLSMKRILSLAVAASMLLSAIPAMAETATEATYIPAPYNAEEVNPTKTYLEPVFYQNENGPTIGVTTVGVIQQDGLYFKDSDNDHELDAFEDWRLPAGGRA